MGNWNRHFVRVGSDGHIQVYTKGNQSALEILQNIAPPNDGGVENLQKPSIQSGYVGSTVGDGSRYGAIFTSNGYGAFYDEAYSGNNNAPIVDIENFANGGFKFRLDNRTGNISGLNGMPSSNAQWYLISSKSSGGLFVVDTSGNWGSYGLMKSYLNAPTAMDGIPTIQGSPDLRTGVTAADASPITIFSSTTSGVRYEVKARILATAGTSATYKIVWTEDGVAQPVSLTITAVDTEVHDNFVIAPDAGTDITAQITSLTSSTVNVDAIVSVLG